MDDEQDAERLLNSVGDAEYAKALRDEFLKARATQRQSRRVSAAAYPSDKSVHPCSHCGRPYTRPHGHGWTPETGTCPVCQKDMYRDVADIMGWKWPRQKTKKLTAEDIVEALLGAV